MKINALLKDLVSNPQSNDPVSSIVMNYLAGIWVHFTLQNIDNLLNFIWYLGIGNTNLLKELKNL